MMRIRILFGIVLFLLGTSFTCSAQEVINELEEEKISYSELNKEKSAGEHGSNTELGEERASIKKEQNLQKDVKTYTTDELNGKTVEEIIVIAREQHALSYRNKGEHPDLQVLLDYSNTLQTLTKKELISIAIKDTMQNE